MKKLILIVTFILLNTGCTSLTPPASDISNMSRADVCSNYMALRGSVWENHQKLADDYKKEIIANNVDCL